jgi:hypothetical protein
MNWEWSQARLLSGVHESVMFDSSFFRHYSCRPSRWSDRCLVSSQAPFDSEVGLYFSITA